MTTHPGHDSSSDPRTVRAGVATLDITPSGSMAMSGFAARTTPSSGVHDPLSVRALVIERTALVTVDVVGLHEELCARVREAVRPWADHAIVHATHTHSGPTSMPGRLGDGLDEDWLAHVESSCVEGVRRAATAREPATLTSGYGEDPGVGRNRRRRDGPVDPAVPLIRLTRPDGTTLALLVSYACHPVVLSAQNALLSADYPGFTRRYLEAATGAITLFATSCAGDINTGHALDGLPDDPRHRTFETCEKIGRRVAKATLQSNSTSASSVIDAAHSIVEVPFEELSSNDSTALAAHPPGEQSLEFSSSWRARVSAFRWGSTILVALPGEPFAHASLEIRRQLASLTDIEVVVVLGYSDGCPGYFPACGEYALGGYEVEQAHHYYGMPSAFAEGALEQLTQTAIHLASSLRPASGYRTETQQPSDRRHIASHT